MVLIDAESEGEVYGWLDSTLELDALPVVDSVEVELGVTVKTVVVPLITDMVVFVDADVLPLFNMGP